MGMIAFFLKDRLAHLTTSVVSVLDGSIIA
jgi:hypothetical protein